MKKTEFGRLIAVGLCICSLTGCGSIPGVNSDNPQHTVSSNTDDSSESEMNDLLDHANMTGSVLEFTDKGCLVNQSKDIAGGAGLKKEAEGAENKDKAVTVTYNSNCEFVIATANVQSGDITNVTTGSISDVKKQSNIHIYGEFSDSLHFNANKVVILRLE